MPGKNLKTFPTWETFQDRIKKRLTVYVYNSKYEVLIDISIRCMHE